MSEVQDTSWAIVKTTIDKHVDGRGRSVDQFTTEVQTDVQHQMDALTLQYGDAVRDLADETMQTVKNYKETRNEVIGTSGAKVEDLSGQKADGVCDMQAKTISLDQEHYMQLGSSVSEDQHTMWHAAKVVKHEQAHQQLQAAKYDREELVLDPAAGKKLKVVGSVTEGQAIEKGQQENGELPPDYQLFKQEYAELLMIIDKPTVERGLKTGNMTEVQEEIENARPDQFTEARAKDEQPETAMAA